MEVARLNDDLKEIIRSGYCVNSVTQCVNELVLNALDANSSHVTVGVNLVTFRVQVVDDGRGIAERDLHHVGKRHHTSKCRAAGDLEKARRQFGFRGEALASIAANARTVRIVSRAWSGDDTQPAGATFQKTIAGDEHRIEETGARASGGTTVTVTGFMCNLPVRQKRTGRLEFDDVARNLRRLFILHPRVAISLRDDSTKRMLYGSTAVDTVEAALFQNVENLDERCVKYYSVTKGRTTVKILIHLKPHENNEWQLFYVNKLPIKSPRLACHVNEILSKSALGSAREGRKTRTLRSANAGNFVYLINIVCPNSKYRVVNFDEVEFANVGAILKIVERQLLKILEKEDLLRSEPTAKKKEICPRGDRIRLSGFAGAFKASAVRKPGEEDAIVEREMRNLFATKDEASGESSASEFQPNIPGRRPTTTASSNEPEDMDVGPSQSCDEGAEEDPPNYYVSSNRFRTSEMRNAHALETTSTLGRLYVMNKFLENDLFADRRRRERKLAEERRNREMEVERQREIQRQMYMKEVAAKEEYERQRKMRESRRNEEALARYYRYRHSARHEDRRRACRQKEQFLWDDTRDVLRSMEIESGPEADWKLGTLFRRYDCSPPRKRADEIDLCNRRFPSRPRPNVCQLDVPKLPRYLDRRDDSFGFLQLDKETFDDHHAFRPSRRSRRADLFARTVCELDLSAGEERRLPQPQEKRRRADFFRIRASEKTTRLKGYSGSGGKMEMRSERRTTIVTSTRSTARTAAGVRTRRRKKTRTIVSYSRRTVETPRSKPARRKPRTARRLANKATNTSSVVGDACGGALEGSLVVMERSIQCTLGEHRLEENNADSSRKPPIIKVIQDVTIAGPIQDANITSNENYGVDGMVENDNVGCTQVDNKEGEVEIIENSQANLDAIHPCTLKLQEKMKTDAAVSETKADDERAQFFATLSAVVAEIVAEWPTATDERVATTAGNDDLFDLFDEEFRNDPENKHLFGDRGERAEWSRKIDEQGGSYYINRRTGNTLSQLPAPREGFELRKRPVDLPKGFSQTLKETVRVAETVSERTKREFHAAVCESYREDEDLARVKWKKHYLQSADYEEFFKKIYDKEFIVAEGRLRLPMRRPNSVAFSEDMLRQLDVLNQYDRKFIVALWTPRDTIVAFDQHAVDERIRLERLLKKYIHIKQVGAGKSPQFATKAVDEFRISCNLSAAERCRNYLRAFEKFGLKMTHDDDDDDDALLVAAVPACLYNKAARGESSKRKEKLAELTASLVHEIAGSIFDAVCSSRWVPPMLIDMVNSEACRGAVMFGDALSVEECGRLISDLSSCDLPFQCAHGRPTCVPLCELSGVKEQQKEKINFSTLRNRRWKK